MGIHEEFEEMVAHDPLLQELAMLGEESPMRQVLRRLGQYAVRFFEGVGKGQALLMTGMTPELTKDDQA